MLGNRMSRRGLILLGLITLVAAGWVYLWFLASHTLKNTLDSWVVAERAQGSELHFTGPQISGFPLRVRATIGDVTVSRPDGLVWHGPEVSLDMPLWRVKTPHVQLVGHQDGRLPAALGGMAISVDGADAWLTLGGIQGFTEARIVLSGLGLEPVTVKRIELSASVPAAVVSSHAETGLMVTVAADGVHVLEAGSAALGTLIESLSATARVTGAPPRLEHESLSAWSREGGTLELDTANLRWGALTLGAEGSLGLDQSLQPAGTLVAEVEGFDVAVDELAAAGWIKPKNVKTTKAVLAGLTQKTEGGVPSDNPIAKIPLSLHDRFVHVGPFRLMPLPPVVWR
jgi:hypothetical protein